MAYISYDITMIPSENKINVTQRIEDKFLESIEFYIGELPQDSTYKIYDDIKFNAENSNVKVYSNINSMTWNNTKYNAETLIFTMSGSVERTETVVSSVVCFPINITINKGGSYTIGKESAVEGENKRLNIYPNSGFQISQIISDVDFQETWNLGFESTSNLFIMPAATVNIEIVFKQIVPHQGKIMINDSQKYFIYTAGSKCNVYKDGKRFI